MDILQRLGIYKIVIKRIAYRMDNQYNLDIVEGYCVMNQLEDFFYT